VTDIRELVKEAREAAHYADEYAGERELWTRVADALEAQAKEIAELKEWREMLGAQLEKEIAQTISLQAELRRAALNGERNDGD